VLNLNKQLKFSSFTGIYDMVIPQNHLLRKIAENIDFSFVNKLMEKCYCIDFGRPAYEPELILKTLFLKLLYDLSDREVISRCQTDMAFKFFLGLNPEDDVPDASLLAKFRTLRITEEELQEFLNETVRQALDNNIIKSKTIIVDSTHSRSKHTPQTPTQILREITKNLRKEIHRTQNEISNIFPEKPTIEDDIFEEIDYTKTLVAALEEVDLKSEKAQKLLAKVKKTLELPNLVELQSANDEDAKIGHKSEDNDFFGYKNHIAMTEEGIITGLSVTNGTAADNKEFENIVNQTLEIGVEVEDIAGDKAYSTSDILKFGIDKNINIISKLKENVGSKEFNDKYVSFNKDADTYECKNGCLAKKNNVRKNGSIGYSFYRSDCEKCPFSKECLDNKDDGYKRVLQNVNHEIFEEQRVFEATEHFKEKHKIRWKIEQRNSHLKNQYGLKKTYGTGLWSMKAQSFLTAFTANIVKITKLVATI
jgi:IS5 family transposase